MAHEPVSLYKSERRALSGQLRDISPRLAGLYRRLIRLLDEQPSSEEHLAWASLVGHCVRELINRLPDVLADVPLMLDPVKPKSSELVQRLPALMDRYTHVEGQFSAPAQDSRYGRAPELAPVPRPLFEALQRISHATERETARALERDAVVVARARTASGPAYDRWRTARKFFMDFTHLDNHIGQDERPLPSSKAILEHLETIELTLSTRLTKFFDNRRNLDDFLAEVNRAFDDPDHELRCEYIAPVSRAFVRDVLTRIGSLQLRRVFYGGMQNPLWVSALAEEGAFKSPPEPRKDDDGNAREEPWPEMDYLVRMARTAPREVVDVGLTLITSKNSWVKRGLVEIAATVPTEDAARLAAGLRRWGPNNYGWRTDPRHLVMMTENLLVGGEFALGMKFASGLFHPKKPKSQVPLDSGYVVGLEEYWYDQSLPQIAVALGENGLDTLVLWLESYEKLSGRFNEDADSDFSYVGRPDIECRHTGAPDVEGALIDAVRDAALSRMRIAPAETLRALMRSKQPLVKRICLFAVGEVLMNGTRCAGSGSCRCPSACPPEGVRTIRVSDRILEVPPLVCCSSKPGGTPAADCYARVWPARFN